MRNAQTFLRMETPPLWLWTCYLRMETPLRGRSGGHTGTAPTVSFGWIAHERRCASPYGGAHPSFIFPRFGELLCEKSCARMRCTAFLWNGLPQRGSLQEGFELFFDGGFVGCTDEFVDEFAVFKEKDGGDVAHAKVGGYLVVFFDVAFAYH